MLEAETVRQAAKKVRPKRDDTNERRWLKRMILWCMDIPRKKNQKFISRKDIKTYFHLPSCCFSFANVRDDFYRQRGYFAQGRRKLINRSRFLPNRSDPNGNKHGVFLPHTQPTQHNAQRACPERYQSSKGRSSS